MDENEEDMLRRAIAMSLEEEEEKEEEEPFSIKGEFNEISSNSKKDFDSSFKLFR